ncbi:hypothetical protein [Butyrivibrio sp. AE3004]|nr:hypothetical protein [Butyrivibrio sp. AE3004]
MNKISMEDFGSNSYGVDEYIICGFSNPSKVTQNWEKFLEIKQ